MRTNPFNQWLNIKRVQMHGSRRERLFYMESIPLSPFRLGVWVLFVFAGCYIIIKKPIFLHGGDYYGC